MAEEKSAVKPIVVTNVYRMYQKYSERHRFKTFKSALVKGDFFRSLRPDELVTALENVSFSVERGETFGVIGENGSGKSTLLKLIAGIAKPSEGIVEVTGKVSALIELGAGFHPEITGRENVFINGIMLGLSKKEINEKFDEIVRFAELEGFIDAPVKTYSSGMYMRLGFSIAINVNPEILLIDEVLAVGDASFVPKCLDKIDDFRRRKKTILFVSHDLATVEKICDRICWLKNGKVITIGDPKRVIDAYLSDVAEQQEAIFEARKERVQREILDVKISGKDGKADDEEKRKPETDPPPGSQAHKITADPDDDDQRREQRWGKREIEIKKVRLTDLEGREKNVFSPEDGMQIILDVEAYSRIKDFVFGIGIFNSQGVQCYGTNTFQEDLKPRSIEGSGKISVIIKKLRFVNGTYYLDVAVHKIDGYPYDYHRNLYSFMISSLNKDVGIARPDHMWSFDDNIKIKSPPDK